MGDLIKPDLLITQLVGFLIVLWVLKRFAWKPILGMLEARRARIEHDLSSAQKLREEAEKLRVQYEEHLKAIETERRQVIQQAVQEGMRVAEDIRTRAEEDRRRADERAKELIALEYRKARATFRQEWIRLSLGAAERLMHVKLDETQHGKLVEEFLQDLEREPERA